MPDPSLTIRGATALLEGRIDHDDDLVVSSDLVVFTPDMVDRLIATGAWGAGALNAFKVLPPRRLWPERWQFLQDEPEEDDRH